MEEKRPFGMQDKIGYFLGDMGCNFSFQLISDYMLLFYTQCVGLKTTTWAWIIIIAKCWDAINDMLIGRLVDRKQLSPKSKFKPWILLGGSTLITFTVLIFFPAVRNMSYAVKTGWCLLTYCLWSLAYTTVNVPYGSLHSVITEKERERTALSAFRAFGIIPPILLIILLPQIVYITDAKTKHQSLSPERLFTVALICAVVAFVAFYAMTKMVEERVVHQKKVINKSYISTIISFFKNRSLLGVTIGTIGVVALYNSSMSVNNLVFQFYFGDAKNATLAMVASYLPLLIFMPFASRCVERFGKKKIIVTTSLFSVVVGLIALVLPITPDKRGMIIYIIVLVFLNIGCCVFQIIVWAIVADCIEKSYEETGVDESASLYALYSFFRKLSQGIGSAVVALGLGIVGFEGHSITQTAETALGIKNLYIMFLTLAVAILGISMQCMYNIGRKNITTNA